MIQQLLNTMQDTVNRLERFERSKRQRKAYKAHFQVNPKLVCASLYGDYTNLQGVTSIKEGICTGMQHKDRWEIIQFTNGNSQHPVTLDLNRFNGTIINKQKEVVWVCNYGEVRKLRYPSTNPLS